MAKLEFLGTNGLDSQQAFMSCDRMQQLFSMQRKPFERRWYDNNFFDDGHHFRYVSRVTGKIVDTNDRVGLNDPKRAIPKASRQIRGVANLLSQADYMPVVYPEQPSPVSGMGEEEANKASLDLAKKVGTWIQREWKNQELVDKMVQLILLAAKNSVSYLQVWPDEAEQKVKSKVWDAFDIYLQGQLTDIYDSPVIIKCVPMLINQIKNDAHYDEKQRAKMSPDNKYAASEIKEAYMRAKFGFNSAASDSTATILFKECYCKEYIDEKNLPVIQQQENAEAILSGKKMGDVVIRQIMGAGQIWLSDTYTDLPEYPFVDFRFEPGPIYQTSLIERFIPLNKTLDTLMSRLEKYANTMITGTWMKRKGENFDITNIAGAQVINYETTPPVQGQMANVPPFYFEAIGLLNSFIDEQGVATSALNNIPSGVRANAAIESLKETEYANLKIATNQVKKVIRRFTERMLDIADKYYIEPQNVQTQEQGMPSTFRVIGNSGAELMQQAGMPTGDIVPLKRDYKVEIEIESGAAYTYEGKKQLINSYIDRMIQLAQAGYMSQEAVKFVISKANDIYKLGSTAEFMEAMDTQPNNTTDEELKKIQIAVAQVIKDLGIVGPQASQQHIQETKIGVVEAAKDTGMLQKSPQISDVSKSITYKDAPPDIRRQIEEQAGLNPSVMPEQPAPMPAKVQGAINQANQLPSNNQNANPQQ